MGALVVEDHLLDHWDLLDHFLDNRYVCQRVPRRHSIPHKKACCAIMSLELPLARRADEKIEGSTVQA